MGTKTTELLSPSHGLPEAPYIPFEEPDKTTLDSMAHGNFNPVSGKIILPTNAILAINQRIQEEYKEKTKPVPIKCLGDLVKKLEEYPIIDRVQLKHPVKYFLDFKKEADKPTIDPTNIYADTETKRNQLKNLGYKELETIEQVGRLYAGLYLLSAKVKESYFPK